MKNERNSFTREPPSKASSEKVKSGETIYKFKGLIDGTLPIGDGCCGDLPVSGRISARNKEEARRMLRKHYSKKYAGYKIFGMEFHLTKEKRR